MAAMAYDVTCDLLGMLAIAGMTCVGLVFVLAGAQKLRHRRVLSRVIANYRLLPEALVAPAAALLPPAELLLGVLLLADLAEPATPLAALLLVLFAAAMAVNIRRGRGHIDCGCGQSFLRQDLRWSLVARNALLIAALLPSLAATPAPAEMLLTGIAAGASLFVLYLAGNVLAALPSRGPMAGAQA